MELPAERVADGHSDRKAATLTAGKVQSQRGDRVSVLVDDNELQGGPCCSDTHVQLERGRVRAGSNRDSR